MPRRYLDRPGSTGGDELSENYRDWRTGFFMCIRLRSKKGSIRTYALSTTVLAQLNEYDRTRAFPISPWTPPRGPMLDLGRGVQPAPPQPRCNLGAISLRVSR